jgi:LPXTG-site transpeptidase (sortase) family protein
LALPEEPFAQILIPSLKINTPVVKLEYSEDQWDIRPLNRYAGWLENTGEIGQAGNSVLIGHLDMENDLSGAFIDLNKITKGAEIDVIYADRVYVYRVNTITSIYDIETWILRSTSNPQLTLITCLRGSWDPYTRTYTHRLAVIASLENVKILPEKSHLSRDK